MKQQSGFYAKVRRNPIFRVISVLCVLLILGLIVSVFVTGITGSRYFLACLVLMIVVPCLLYVFLWIGRLLSDSYDEKLEKLSAAGEPEDDEKKS